MSGKPGTLSIGSLEPSPSISVLVTASIAYDVETFTKRDRSVKIEPALVKIESDHIMSRGIIQ